MATDEEIGKTSDQGKEAVIALIHETLGWLAAQIEGLEDRISKIVKIVASHPRVMG